LKIGYNIYEYHDPARPRGGRGMRCEGFRRYGGAFTLGPIEWEQCEENAIVYITTRINNKKQIIPSCKKCWEESIENGIKIIEVKPVEEA